MPAEIEQDPLFQLLTDALRAGPGSPAWREAVSKLKDASAAPDEYTLILQARERLESGKEWRSIRAGAGFTRKIMSALDQEEPPSARGFPTAKIVAIIAALVLILLIASGIYYASSGPPMEQSAVRDLNNVFFAQTISAATFDTTATPTGWRTIGALPLTSNGGLYPTSVPAGAGYVGGGLLCETPAPQRQPFCVEAQLRLEKLSEDVIPQVFVTDDPTFSPDRGTSSHELVWLAGSEGMRVVLPDGHVAQSEPLKPSRDLQIIRIEVGSTGAIVELSGRKIWSGPHLLRDGQSWYVGVRFLAKSGSAVQPQSFASVKLLRAEVK